MHQFWSGPDQDRIEVFCTHHLRISLEGLPVRVIIMLILFVFVMPPIDVHFEWEGLNRLRFVPLALRLQGLPFLLWNGQRTATALTTLRDLYFHFAYPYLVMIYQSYQSLECLSLHPSLLHHHEVHHLHQHRSLQLILLQIRSRHLGSAPVRTYRFWQPPRLSAEGYSKSSFIP